MVLVFKDFPEFTPNLTPYEIFKRGSFGGTYFRPIFSTVNKKKYKNIHLKYPFLKNLPNTLLITPFEQYNVEINKYKVKVGTTLEYWEKKDWIHSTHPYGWVHWYCDFYEGKRTPGEDERQIKRWLRTAGPNSRFRKRLINLIRKNRKKYNDVSVSPKIRQTLQHWAYELTEKDFQTSL